MSSRLHRRFSVPPAGGARARLLVAAALCSFLASSLAHAADPTTAPGSGGIQISAESLPCPAGSRIPERLQTLLASTDLDSASLVLTLQPARPGVLVLRLDWGQEDYLRAISFSTADCQDLPETLAAIVRGWLRHSSHFRTRATPPTPDHAPLPPPAATLTAPVASRPVAPARWHLAASGGLAAAPTHDQVAPTFAFAAEWKPSARLGLAALGALDSPVSAALDASSRISATLRTAALLARMGLLSLNAAELDLLAGPALEWLAVRFDPGPGMPAASNGFLNPALVVLLRWRQPLTSRLAVTLAAGIVSRAHTERLHGGAVAEVFDIPPARGQLLLGLDLRL